jgi:cell division protein FtsI (penicillin-binding protein 3)
MTTGMVRHGLVLGAFFLFVCGLSVRAVQLQLLHKDFLQTHADARHLRVVEQPAHRGIITDRNEQPLAISTPVGSIWTNPSETLLAGEKLAELAEHLGYSTAELKDLLASRAQREFVYLRRHVEPELAAAVMQMGVPGVHIQSEYKRYYPGSEVFAHLIGFSNIDDSGQEGLELSFDDWLKGRSGAKRVVKDRLGRIIENVESIRAPALGRDLVLSIDKRVQYLAYRELKAAVLAHRARAGSVVVIDVRSGELLALVNQPSFNPNNRRELKGEFYRNRAVTDLFEPGSTLKPFTIAAALESGLYEPESTIDTHPGQFAVGHHIVRDIHNYGVIDVATVIRKSSNVGAAKIALSLDPESLAGTLTTIGFGRTIGSGFPGETPGHLADAKTWRDIEQATIAFGYGLSVTALQLAQAYQVLANDGVKVPLSVLRQDLAVSGERVWSSATAGYLRSMLEAVVESGTGRKAKVPSYRTAGKTGTVHKTVEGAYAEDRYLSLFAGFVPASDPRLVAVIVVDEPKGEYFGGLVAAPIFSHTMSGALRLLNIPPDDLPAPVSRLADSGD